MAKIPPSWWHPAGRGGRGGAALHPGGRRLLCGGAPGGEATQVYDVISFYTALHDKPRAKFTLEVCSSAPCRVKDSDTLLERLKRLLNLEVGQVTYDGRFSIEQVPCFGACDVAPRAARVVYGHLDSEERILDMLQQLN